MDHKDMEDNGMRTRSFRYEDYNNRRAFLRSYPLHLGEEDEHADQDTVKVTNDNTGKKPMKEMILSVFHWGEGKILVLRKVKDKFNVYATACIPTGFKDPKALISA